MARASELAAFRQAQADVATLAYAEIVSFWQTLDLTDPIAVVRALEAYLPHVIQAYGEVGAGIAADFYESLREQSPAIRKAYTAVLGDAIPIGAVEASARWAVGPLFGRGKIQTPEQALSNVISVTNRFVLGAGRETITTNVERDPERVRYARVPTGAHTCAFCLVQASRGAVYTSSVTAGRDFHGHCDCVPTPVWEGDALPEGYDPKALHEIYLRGRRESTGDGLKGSDGILAAVRKAEGIS